ncbi:MAG TPA: 2'-5' RNA ligase family protein [Chloroflexota bacterium]|jgi:hypothetical protein
MADQADEYAAAWATFEQLALVAPHRADWAAWAAGRGRHKLFMVLVRDAAAIRAIQSVQQQLYGLTGVEFHAAHFFHISVQSCGFDDALTVDADRVRTALLDLKAFEVVLAGVNAFHSAVFVETHSGGNLLALRAALREALGPDIQAIDSHSGFLFHLTVGYLTAHADVRQVRQAIAALRDVEVAHVQVQSLALVEVPTDQRVPFPRLEPTATFPLGRVVRRL